MKPPRGPNFHGASDPSAERIGKILQEVLSAIQSIRYGSVEITIHDSRMVQIERREKVRFHATGQAN